MSVGVSVWCAGYIAAASDMGMMHSALDWRNCIAAPTSSSMSFATSRSVPSFDHLSQAWWLLPPSPVSPLINQKTKRKKKESNHQSAHNNLAQRKHEQHCKDISRQNYLR